MKTNLKIASASPDISTMYQFILFDPSRPNSKELNETIRKVSKLVKRLKVIHLPLKREDNPGAMSGVTATYS
ncbi:unnamed protein product [Callosobruchus maculatus]|uniref:Uncharacterized protein n=1 Tax=Callosobruchus maculatus TaxID=64391 RepID=A0A653BP00_CALMS|nr:unnamed protein product [Callosobruchus maculatus]